MNSPFLRSCLLIIPGLFLLYDPASAQTKNTFLSDSTGLISFVQKEYGPDMVLNNGLYPEDYIMDALGHPFFMDTVFYPGYIILHNQKFDNVLLKYNIFDQNIIVYQPDVENGSFQIIPPNKFIAGFNLSGKIFRKFCFDGVNEDFYQVVYDGKIKCLYSFYKNRYISYHTSKYSSFKFTKGTRKSFLLIDQKLSGYHNTGSFLQYFPEKERPEIKAYFKKAKLRLSKASDQEIRKLMEFYENNIRRN